MALVQTNQAPVAHDDFITTTTGTPIIFNPLNNDFDSDDDSLSIFSVINTNPFSGNRIINVNSGLHFIPAVGFEGEAHFIYRITDGHGGQDYASITIVVTPEQTVSEIEELGGAVTISQSEDGVVTALALLSATGPSQSEALALPEIAPPEIVAYQSDIVRQSPNVPVIKHAEVHVAVDDGTVLTLQLDDDVTEDDGNDPSSFDVSLLSAAELRYALTTMDDFLSTGTGLSLKITADEIISNDLDPEGDPLELAAVYANDETHGQLLFDADTQIITYTPNEGFTGVASFYVQVSNGELLNSSRAVVDVSDFAELASAGEGSSVPTEGHHDAMDDFVLSGEDQPVVLDFAELLANDPAAHGDQWTIDSVIEATNGSVEIDKAAETITFTPDVGFIGTADFIYNLTDGVEVDGARVTIAVG